MSKFLIKYHPKKPYDNLQVWNMDILKVSNPTSHAYKDEVFYAKKEYDYIKDFYSKWKSIDGSVISHEGFKWLLTEANDALDAIDIFRKKLKEEESK